MVMVTKQNKTKLVLCILASFTLPAIAGDMKISPKALIDETYSNNVGLNQADKTSSIVSQIGMELEALYESKNVMVKWNSRSKYVYYSHDHDSDKDFHDLESNLDWKLWPSGLRFIANASIQNVSRNRSNNAYADIISGDVVRTGDYSAGFAFNVTNSDFDVDSSINYQLSEAEDNIGERNGYGLFLDAKNGSGARYSFWEINSSYQNLENNNNKAEFYDAELKLGWITGYDINPFIRYYDESNEGNIGNNRSYESNSIGIGLRWLINPRLFIELSYNDPIDDVSDLENQPLENYLSSYIRWQPSPRTTLSASHSQRFFGDTYSLQLKHRTKRLENEINYQEEVNAFTRNNLDPFTVGLYWCPLSDNTNLSECFINDGQNINFDDYTLLSVTDFNVLEDQEYTLNKVLQWSSTLSLPRTTFTLQINRNERIRLENNVSDIYTDASLTVTRKISGRSDIIFTYKHTDHLMQEGGESERNDVYKKYQIDYSKRLSSKFSISGGVGLLERTSDLALFNYDENRVHFKFTKEF
jgi:uncharacterized protein (PEP-CTERM system associated)